MTMKTKPGYSYDRGKDQVPVHSVGIYQIMSRPTFALGVGDARDVSGSPQRLGEASASASERARSWRMRATPGGCACGQVK